VGKYKVKFPCIHENRSTLQSHYCAEVKDHFLGDFLKACK
jgi:hypothetical protein